MNLPQLDLRLRVIQAAYGDCLILEYGQAERTGHILIDGGPDGVYASHLKPELEAIAAGGKGKIDLMVLTHVDEDHVVGLVDLMSDLATAKGRGTQPFISVERLWYNTFRQMLGEDGDLAGSFSAFAAAPGVPANMQHFAFSVTQGEDLWKASEILEVPRNTDFPGGLVSLEGSPRPVELEGLRLWILGPSQPNLKQYEKDWAAWYAKHKDHPFGAGASRQAREIDRSVANLSSIMFLAETAGRRILLTGDGRCEDLVEGLKQVGLMGAGGLHVDVLKVPHHGSDRNNSREFFDQVTASQYVISAGKHKNDGNPDFDTLEWIVEAATQRQEQIQILVTNPNASTGRLEKLYPPASSGYRISYLQPGENSVVI
jgi:beta-lactamase superfamily II metal-dependent hydrolase